MIVTDYLVSVFLELSHLHCANFKRQAEQGDEAVCIVVIVKVAGGEGCQDSLYKEYGEVVPALMMLPLYSLNLTSPVTYSWVEVTNAWIASHSG